MMNYINSILTSSNANNTTYKWLVSIAFIYAGVKLVNNVKTPFTIAEGFNQSKPYVYKKDENVYDDFMSEIYDELYETNSRTDWELAQIIRLTSPDTNNSVFLDLGSGTGQCVNMLKNNGYRVYGVDKSQNMVKYAENKYPNIDIISANINDSMTFERSSFTHILCTKMTIYQFKNKKLFFNNCYRWMIPNGYLILHLVDRKRFNLIKPKHVDELKWTPLVQPKKKRCTSIVSEYEDFKYKANYTFPVNLEETNIVCFNESFTDKVTNHVRDNEQTLFMENITDIINMAKQVGFIFHAKVDMGDIGDDNQYLYILERPH